MRYYSTARRDATWQKITGDLLGIDAYKMSNIHVGFQDGHLYLCYEIDGIDWSKTYNKIASESAEDDTQIVNFLAINQGWGYGDYRIRDWHSPEPETEPETEPEPDWQAIVSNTTKDVVRYEVAYSRIYHALDAAIDKLLRQTIGSKSITMRNVELRELCRDLTQIMSIAEHEVSDGANELPF